MATGGLERPAHHLRWLGGAAILVVVAQGVLAYRAASGYGEDFWVTTWIAWLAALYLVWQSRDVPAETGIAWRTVGFLLALGTVVAMALPPHYHAYDRFMPLVAGAGLGLAAFGPAFGRRLGGSLALLALPLINPMPLAIRHLVSPCLISLTAHGTVLLHRVAGSPVAIEGSPVGLEGKMMDLTTPGGILHIQEGCCGILGIARLWVIAALVVALFPTTWRQKVLLFATGAAIGLLMNIAHVAMMTRAVVHRDDASFDYWHQGSGGSLMAVGSMGMAGLCWWLATRRPLSSASTRSP
jgi:exosortase/archaeosortase family protein